jgi:hypothetical protein
MKITQIYAISGGANVILILFLFCCCAASVHRDIRLLDRCTRRAFRWLSRPFRIVVNSATFRWSQLIAYPNVVGRHPYVGPWRLHQVRMISDVREGCVFHTRNTINSGVTDHSNYRQIIYGLLHLNNETGSILCSLFLPRLGVSEHHPNTMFTWRTFRGSTNGTICEGVVTRGNLVNDEVLLRVNAASLCGIDAEYGKSGTVPNHTYRSR